MGVVGRFLGDPDRGRVSGGPFREGRPDLGLVAGASKPGLRGGGEDTARYSGQNRGVIDGSHCRVKQFGENLTPYTPFYEFTELKKKIYIQKAKTGNAAQRKLEMPKRRAGVEVVERPTCYAITPVFEV
jgi:hypothetical protein